MNPLVLYVIFLALVFGLRLLVEASERRAYRRHYTEQVKRKA